MTRESANSTPTRAPSFWGADRLAYIAVLAGAMAQFVQAFTGSGTAETADGAWYWFAVPLMLVAIYAVIHGIALRRQLATLGDFDASERHSAD